VAQSGRNFFYDKKEIDAAAFPSKAQFIFPFQATRVIIVNDSSSNDIEFSFRKPHLDGEILSSDGPLVFDQLSEGKLWFRGTKKVWVRVWAWRGAN